MQAQVECGTLCPTTMTYGAVAAMRRDAWLDRDWVPRLLTRDYDPRDIPIEHKRGGLIGMGMTEKQGGSDVRANTTRAVRIADGSHRITGHKWFSRHRSAMRTWLLAQTDRGLSCFFMPRRLPDGSLFPAPYRHGHRISPGLGRDCPVTHYATSDDGNGAH